MILTYYCIITMIIIAYLLGSIPSAVWIGKNITASTSGNTAAKRRYDQHAAGAGTPGSPAGLSAGFPQGIRRGHIDRDPQIRRLHQRYVADKYQDHRRIRRRARTHLPHFAGFRGGKGVATLVGAITGIYPPVVLLCFAVWVVILMMTHYVSLASIVAGCCFPIFTIVSPKVNQSVPFIVFSFVTAVLLLYTHRKNIVRLKNGTESKIYIWKPHRKADK